VAGERKQLVVINGLCHDSHATQLALERLRIDTRPGQDNRCDLAQRRILGLLDPECSTVHPRHR
jgi:hypothetical protein